MGKWVHRLKDVDPEARSAVCVHCGPTSVRRMGGGWKCNSAGYQRSPEATRRRSRKSWKRRQLKYKIYRLHKGPVCGRCGFLPEHPCQLDVDHIDGNHFNHDRSNLQTLCANCHRLKTWNERHPASIAA